MKTLSNVFFVLLVLVAVFYVVNEQFQWVNLGTHKPAAVTGAKDIYYCPMHPDIQSDKPGECPQCHMSLVKRTAAETPAMGHDQAAEKKILYYRNPMHPQVTSPTPMKDEMGMDYVPVYEESVMPEQGMVRISAGKQALIGVKKQPVILHDLSGQIVTVGRVAYDPNLFVAQSEYLQALKGRQFMDKATPYAQKEIEAFIQAAHRKLMLLGMSDAEIADLEKQGKPQYNLYLPTAEDKDVWVYITVYEYEAGFVSEGLPVEVETPMYPDKTLKGHIVSIAPVLDVATRSLKVRALVENPGNRLRLDMYVNVKIKYDLGRKLAVPDEAIMHAGMRDMVYVADANGYFMARQVTLGAKAQGYYEVLKGLEPNEMVVTSGNFLVDSESKLSAVVKPASEPKQQ